MAEILYQDKQVVVYRDLIVINRYFFPLATSKTIMMKEIQSLSLVSSEGVTHRWGTCTKYLNNWFALDGQRKNKTKFIEFKLKGKYTKPSITPDDPDKVFRIIWQNHTPEGQKYQEEQKERHSKETEVGQQEQMEQQEQQEQKFQESQTHLKNGVQVVMVENIEQ